MQIKGAVALVTGANRGLGQAYVRALVKRGARSVYAGARHPEDVDDPDVTPLKLNITSPEQVADAARDCGELTLLINNAAELRQSPLIGAGSLEAARVQMETNYFGTLAMCQAFAPVLARNGGGALVNMCSIISFYNRPSIGSFCASKAALWSITNGIRIELRPQATLVVSVHAGFIDTRQAAGFDGPKHDPADIAALVLDAVEAGQEEILADEQTRRTKADLPRDQKLIYPDIESSGKQLIYQCSRSPPHPPAADSALQNRRTHTPNRPRGRAAPPSSPAGRSSTGRSARPTAVARRSRTAYFWSSTATSHTSGL